MSLQTRVRLMADCLERSIEKDGKQTPLVTTLIIKPERILADQDDAENQKTIDCFNQAIARAGFQICAPEYSLDKGGKYAYLQFAPQESGDAFTFQFLKNFPKNVRKKVKLRVEAKPDDQTIEIQVKLPPEINPEDVYVDMQTPSEKRITFHTNDINAFRERFPTIVLDAISQAKKTDLDKGNRERK